MGFFSKNRKKAGWLAVRFHADGISAACVSPHPTGIPAVKSLIFLPADRTSQAELLERFAKEADAGHYNLICLLRGDEYQIVSVEAPTVQPEELKTAIRWRLKDMLDFHVNDATIDVLDIPVDKAAPSRQHSMYAVAARNSVIEQRQHLFEDADIPLSVIDIPEMAQRNIADLLTPEGRGLAMLSFDAEGGLLTVNYAGELYLCRRIDTELSTFIHGDEEQVNAGFEKITLELQRSFDHFERQYHFITIAKLVLAPAAENISGLQAYLGSNLYLKVESLDLRGVLDTSAFPELKSSEMQQRYFLTLGAALRHEDKVL